MAQSEAIATLPALLDDVNRQPVVISREGREVAALVSMEDYQRVRRVSWERMDEISRQAGAQVDAHAAELGISSGELVERLLHDDE